MRSIRTARPSDPRDLHGVTNAAIAPSLGRNLAACGAAVVCNANLSIQLFQPVGVRDGSAMDLRFSRTLPLGADSRIRAGLDIYNVFNASHVLA